MGAPAGLALPDEDLSLVVDPFDKLHDHCGVVGIAADQDVASWLYYAMQSLQHRGQ